MYYFYGDSRKITRHISCCQAGQENGIGCMRYMGFEK